MYYLALDTCNRYCSVTIFNQEKIIDSNQTDKPSMQAEKMIDVIDSLLKKNGISISEIQKVFLTTGPGSFTGLRIGISFVKGIKFANKEIEFHGISTMQAIASLSKDGNISTLIDAGRGRFYLQKFQDFKEISEIEMIESNEIENIENKVIYSNNNKEISDIDEITSNLVVDYLNKSKFENLKTIEPIYIRESI